VFLGRVPKRGEALWTEADRQWAIALMAYEADVCSGCGHPRSETTQIHNEFAYAGEAIRCHACAAVARASEAFTVPGANARGLLIGVKRREPEVPR
jgi:hypothetical protein